jgi:hypothetical protein
MSATTIERLVCAPRFNVACIACVAPTTGYRLPATAAKSFGFRYDFVSLSASITCGDAFAKYLIAHERAREGEKKMPVSPLGLKSSVGMTIRIFIRVGKKHWW